MNSDLNLNKMSFRHKPFIIPADAWESSKVIDTAAVILFPFISHRWMCLMQGIIYATCTHGRFGI